MSQVTDEERGDVAVSGSTTAYANALSPGRIAQIEEARAISDRFGLAD